MMKLIFLGTGGAQPTLERSTTCICLVKDGESKITFGSIPKNSVVLVVQSTYPPVDTNLLQALSIISQARKVASKIYAIIPNMG